MLQTLHKPYTKLYIEAFKTLHKYYTRKPIVIHAECAFGAAVAALSRHQVIFPPPRHSYKPFRHLPRHGGKLTAARRQTYRGTAVNMPRHGGK